MPPFFGSKDVLKGLGCSSLSDLAKHARDPGFWPCTKKKKKNRKAGSKGRREDRGKEKKKRSCRKRITMISSSYVNVLATARGSNLSTFVYVVLCGCF